MADSEDFYPDSVPQHALFGTAIFMVRQSNKFAPLAANTS